MSILMYLLGLLRGRVLTPIPVTDGLHAPRAFAGRAERDYPRIALVEGGSRIMGKSLLLASACQWRNRPGTIHQGRMTLCTLPQLVAAPNRRPIDSPGRPASNNSHDDFVGSDLLPTLAMSAVAIPIPSQLNDT